MLFSGRRFQCDVVGGQTVSRAIRMVETYGLVYFVKQVVYFKKSFGSSLVAAAGAGGEGANF